MGTDFVERDRRPRELVRRHANFLHRPTNANIQLQEAKDNYRRVTGQETDIVPRVQPNGTIIPPIEAIDHAAQEFLAAQSGAPPLVASPRPRRPDVDEHQRSPRDDRRQARSKRRRDEDADGPHVKTSKQRSKSAHEPPLRPTEQSSTRRVIPPAFPLPTQAPRPLFQTASAAQRSPPDVQFAKTLPRESKHHLEKKRHGVTVTKKKSPRPLSPTVRARRWRMFSDPRTEGWADLRQKMQRAKQTVKDTVKEAFRRPKRKPRQKTPPPSHGPTEASASGGSLSKNRKRTDQRRRARHRWFTVSQILGRTGSHLSYRQISHTQQRHIERQFQRWVRYHTTRSFLDLSLRNRQNMSPLDVTFPADTPNWTTLPIHYRKPLEAMIRDDINILLRRQADGETILLPPSPVLHHRFRPVDTRPPTPTQRPHRTHSVPDATRDRRQRRDKFARESARPESEEETMDNESDFESESDIDSDSDIEEDGGSGHYEIREQELEDESPSYNDPMSTLRPEPTYNDPLSTLRSNEPMPQNAALSGEPIVHIPEVEGEASIQSDEEADVLVLPEDEEPGTTSNQPPSHFSSTGPRGRGPL